MTEYKYDKKPGENIAVKKYKIGKISPHLWVKICLIL